MAKADTSPFFPGKPVPADLFVGREKELDKLRDLISTGTFLAEHSTKTKTASLSYDSTKEFNIPAGIDAKFRMFGTNKEFDLSAVMNDQKVELEVTLNNVSTFILVALEKKKEMMTKTCIKT